MEWEQADTAKKLRQARLWWRVAGEKQLAHWCGCKQRFNHALKVVEEGQSPRRALAFFRASLSPSYVRLLEKVAQHTDVHIYLLKPSAEYWAASQSAKTQAQTVQRRTSFNHRGNLCWRRGGKGETFWINSLNVMRSLMIHLWSYNE